MGICFYMYIFYTGGFCKRLPALSPSESGLVKRLIEMRRLVSFHIMLRRGMPILIHTSPSGIPENVHLVSHGQMRSTALTYRIIISLIALDRE